METIHNKLPSIASLAIPIAIELLLRNLINTMNVFLLSGYSDDAASGVGVANQVINIVLMICMAISVGASVIINYDLGANDREKASVSVMNSVALASLFGAGVSLFLFLIAPDLMQAVNLTGATYDYAARYLRIVGLSSVMIAASQVLSTVFRSYKDAKTSMMVLTGANLFNLLLTWSAIRFEDKLPFDAVEGIGWAKVLCETLGVLVLLTLLIVKGYGFCFRNLFRWDGSRIKRMLAVGSSSIAESLSYNVGTLLTTGFIAASSLGSLALSAKVYVGTVNPYEQIIGNSLGQSGQIIAGKLIGAGEYEAAQKRVNSLWKYLAISNLSCSLLLFAFHRPLMGLFTDNPEVVAITTPLFVFEILINFSRTMSHCFNFGNRAGGYVFWPGVVAVVSLWTIYVGCGYLFCNVLGLGIAGIWLAMTIDETLRGVFCTNAFLKRKWQKKFLPQKS
ncbi:MAG: MATE family efflux transporter [Clostridia bacterium]|nr:MATE family efflux transporter [Clostridia bacterium]MBQ4623369.1 MATE family efflux transporter [Clostridia bacterium]